MLQTALELLILPPGGPLLLIAVAAVVAATRGRFLLLFLSIVLAWLVTTPLVAGVLAASLERAQAISSMQVDGVGAIVVLGAGRVERDHGQGGDVLSPAALERLHHAVTLHRETGLPLLLAGGHGNPPRPASEAALFARAMAAYGVRPRWIEGESLDTCGNARESATLLGRDGIDRVLVVTHAMHMPRALGCFREAGLVPVASPMGYRGTPPPAWSDGRGWFLALMPRTRALETSRFAIREWLARARDAVL